MRSRHEKVPLEGEKITTSKAMKEIEELSIREGESDSSYMEKAARGIFEVVSSVIDTDHVLLLCHKGNNSADAYLVGIYLLEAGFRVNAIQCLPIEEGSELLKRHAKTFLKKGGEIRFLESIDTLEITKESFVIDGLFGTGFKGEVKGLVKDLIEKVNTLNNLVLSIDIPSGISGDTGLAKGATAIYANYTVYLGLLKWGHLFTESFEHVGELIHVDFGMPKKYIEILSK